MDQSQSQDVNKKGVKLRSAASNCVDMMERRSVTRASLCRQPLTEDEEEEGRAGGQEGSRSSSSRDGDRGLTSPSSLKRLLVKRRFYTQDNLENRFPHLPDSTTSLCHHLRMWCRCSTSCVGNTLLGFLPLVKILKGYSWGSWFMVDLLCGFSVGFMHLPQALGFGLLADLSPVHGLYTSLFPVLVYMLFGTSPHVSMGTNAVVALLSAEAIDAELKYFLADADANHTTVSPAALLEYKVGVSTTVCLLEGVILIGMGLLRMGFLTNYMSNSFIGGFSFAAAIHITVSQVVKLFSLKIPIRTGLGKLVATSIDIAQNITETNMADIVVGVVSGVFLLGINLGINQRYKDKLKVPIPAELIVVILSTSVSHFAQLNDRFNVSVVGDIPRGMPVPAVPPLENIVRILPQVFVNAILIFVLTITLAKLTAKLHNISIDDNQELVAYGLCQVVGAFFRNFSSSISPPRTMMLSSMGSKSTLNGLSTSVFLLVVLVVAGPLFVSLPIAMLAVMIIVAMKDLLLQLGNLGNMWYVNKGDFLIWMVTVLFGVLGDLDVGLVAGTLTSMVMVLAYSQLAKGTLLGKAPYEDLFLDTDRSGIRSIPGVRIFRFESQLHFASAERFKSEIYKKVFDPSSVRHKDRYEIDVTVDPRKEPPTSPEPPRTKPSSSGCNVDVGGPGPRQQASPARSSSVNSEKRKSSAAKPDTAAESQDPSASLSGGKSRAEFQGISSSILFNSRKESQAVSIMEEEEEEEEEEEDVLYIILDCSTMTYVDLTGVAMLHLIITQFARAGVTTLLTDVPPTTLAILRRVNFFEHEIYSKVYYNIMDAVHDIRLVRASRKF